MNSSEIWKPVTGFDVYEVSNMGKIRRNGRELRPDKIKSGYSRASFSFMGRHKRALVHRIVAMEFVDGYEPRRPVNHKNGIKTDNRADNLEWSSNRDNIIHAYKNGLIKVNKGEDCHASKLSNRDVDAIKYLLSKGVSGVDLGVAFGVTKTTISAIRTGRSRPSNPIDAAKIAEAA